MNSAKKLFVVSLMISLFCLTLILTDDSSYGCFPSILIAYMIGLISVLITLISGFVWITEYITECCHRKRLSQNDERQPPVA